MEYIQTRKGRELTFTRKAIGLFAGSADTLVKTFGAPSANLRPTSVDFVSTEPQQLLAAYTRSYASVIDLETGRTVLLFDFGDGTFFESFWIQTMEKFKDLFYAKITMVSEI